MGTLPCEERRNSTPDAGISPGNQRHLTLELTGGFVLRSLVARLRTELRFNARAFLVLFGIGRLWIRGLRVLLMNLAFGSHMCGFPCGSFAARRSSCCACDRVVAAQHVPLRAGMISRL